MRTNGDEGTPVPIPNTVVKLVYGDNTWLATAREDNTARTSMKTTSKEVVFCAENKEKRSKKTMCRFNGFQKMGSGLLTGLLALSLCACSGRNQSQSATSNANVENANVESDSNAALFEAEISALAEDETLIHTAIIETNGAALLLTAAEIGSDGTTTECDVYAIVDEKVEKVGQLQSSGTAYPIAYDETWLYSASPHELRCYQMDETTGKLELKKRPFVQFDTEGNATYFLMQGEEETEITEDEYEVAYDEVYSNATVVVFS